MFSSGGGILHQATQSNGKLISMNVYCLKCRCDQRQNIFLWILVSFSYTNTSIQTSSYLRHEYCITDLHQCLVSQYTMVYVSVKQDAVMTWRYTMQGDCKFKPAYHTQKKDNVKLSRDSGCHQTAPTEDGHNLHEENFPALAIPKQRVNSFLDSIRCTSTSASRKMSVERSARLRQSQYVGIRTNRSWST
jgi:hypothetical protein